uniref:RING-type domain-containing protein n=1 Tax=Parascaris univalens TaxID=6257 RepID=A0A915A603_PARUN
IRSALRSLNDSVSLDSDYSSLSSTSFAVVGKPVDQVKLIVACTKQQIKRFVRHNNWPIGHEVRTDLWKELCRDRDFDANKQLYSHEVQVMLQNGVKTLRASFLSAEGVVMHDFGLREIGAVSLQRLLIVIECVRPEITYVPVLYPLCALFLHYMSEEETFACVMHLIRAGNTYIQQSFVAVTASSRTLLALLKRHKSSVYNLLKRRVGTADETILVRALRDWPSWLFRHLPFEYAVRVVDCFIVEGHKMLIRVAIAIVYIWSKEKKRDYSSFAMKTCEERADALGQQFAETAASCPVSVQTLLDAAVGIRNLKGSTIARYQKQFEDVVREEKVSMNMPRIIPSSKLLYTSPFTSQIVNADVATAIMCSLPNRFQLETPRILFRLSDDGSSFTQLWAKIDEAEQTLIVIKSSNGEVFGAYCSASWAERHDAHERARSRYFGTGESFVWKVDVESGQLRVYTWVGNRGDCADNCPQMFMAADDKSLVIGSGGGDAIAIRDELYRGISSACSTFASPPLIKDREFIISQMEVFDIRSGSA